MTRPKNSLPTRCPDCGVEISWNRPRCRRCAGVLRFQGHDLWQEGVERFHASYVIRENGCWEWAKGERTADRYGRIKICGTMWSANRLSWFLSRGPIPDGMFVCHRCNWKRCVNPDHLYLATPGQNSTDAKNDGRYRTGERHPRRIQPKHWPHGERHHAAKLTSEQVALVHQYRAAGQTLESIGREFGVTKNCIFSIVKGKWRRDG